VPEAHWEQVGWIPTSCLGLFGVLLFFVHTCLVLMYSMERSNLTGWRLFTSLHIRRILRIYPLSLLTVASALALHLTSEVNGIHGLSVAPLGGKREIIANFLLIQNLAQVKSIVNVLWSLPYELQMYLLLPSLFLWVRRKATVLDTDGSLDAKRSGCAGAAAHSLARDVIDPHIRSALSCRRGRVFPAARSQNQELPLARFHFPW
jgi:peptidoglycan/LPS O-acetylase OafA/YrhL